MDHDIPDVVQRLEWLSAWIVSPGLGRLRFVLIRSHPTVSLIRTRQLLLWWWHLPHNFALFDGILFRIQVVINLWVLFGSTCWPWLLTSMLRSGTRSWLWCISHNLNTTSPRLLLSSSLPRPQWRLRAYFARVRPSIHVARLPSINRSLAWEAKSIFGNRVVVSYQHLAITSRGAVDRFIAAIAHQIGHAYFILVQFRHRLRRYRPVVRIILLVEAEALLPVATASCLVAFRRASTSVHVWRVKVPIIVECLSKVSRRVHVTLMTIVVVTEQILVLALDYEVLLHARNAQRMNRLVVIRCSHLIIDCNRRMCVICIIFLFNSINIGPSVWRPDQIPLIAVNASDVILGWHKAGPVAVASALEAVWLGMASVRLLRLVLNAVVTRRNTFIPLMMRMAVVMTSRLHLMRSLP